MTIAARAGCDVRTAVRAIREGADAIRNLVTRDNVARAMREIDHGGPSA
jgi:hypothetical protein